MNNANKEVESLTIRPVCLSDMATILELYREGITAPHTSTATPLITNDFGLPLNVILNGDKVIGYSFICVGNSGETELKYRFSTAEKFTKISADLLRSAWDKTKTDDQLSDSVSRLVKWLNNCY